MTVRVFLSRSITTRLLRPLTGATAPSFLPSGDNCMLLNSARRKKVSTGISEGFFWANAGNSAAQHAASAAHDSNLFMASFGKSSGIEPEHRLHGGDQARDLEGLGHVAVGAEGKPLGDVGHLGLAGHHDHRHLRE